MAIVLILAFGAGVFFYLNQKVKSDTSVTEDTVNEGQKLVQQNANAQGLKVAYTKMADGSKLVTVDVESGVQNTLISKGFGEGVINEIIWSESQNKIAFDMCCQDEARGIWIMKADGSGQERLFQYDSTILNLQWSPDGSKLSFVDQPAGDKTLKIVDLDSRQEMAVFNVLNKSGKKGTIDDYFWTSDGKSLIVTAAYERTTSGNELLWESFQISAASGEVSRRFDNKVVGALIGEKIIYIQSSNVSLYPKTIYISDIEGKNEDTLFSSGKDCEDYSVGIFQFKISNDKIAFPVGRGLSACAMERVAILNLQTKNVVETEGPIRDFSWSPDGNYLVIISGVFTPEPKSNIDLYSNNGQFLKTLATDFHGISSSNLIFLNPR